MGEEAGDLDIDRKHFRTFLFNIEPMSFVSIPAPFVGCGQVAAKVWGGNKVLYMIGYAALWLAMIFMNCFAVAGLHVAARKHLGISGDMISDMCAACFGLPWAIGQMCAEDFAAVAIKDSSNPPEKSADITL